MNIKFPKKQPMTLKGKIEMLKKHSIFNMLTKKIKELRKKACQEVPNDGLFEPVGVIFKNSKTGDLCTMSVVPSEIENENNLRYLKLGLEIPDSCNAVTCYKYKGTKQDILDYLGDDRNIDNIDSSLDNLKNTLEKMD